MARPRAARSEVVVTLLWEWRSSLNRPHGVTERDEGVGAPPRAFTVQRVRALEVAGIRKVRVRSKEVQVNGIFSTLMHQRGNVKVRALDTLEDPVIAAAALSVLCPDAKHGARPQFRLRNLRTSTGRPQPRCACAAVEPSFGDALRSNGSPSHHRNGCGSERRRHLHGDRGATAGGDLNNRSTGSIPRLLALGLAVGTLTALGLTLAARCAAAAGALALLKTLGFIRRQLLATVAWQSSSWRPGASSRSTGTGTATGPSPISVAGRVVRGRCTETPVPLRIPSSAR